MIIKYAYAYAAPTGTFFVGLRTGTVQHKISADAMSSIAANEGGVLSWLRRTIVSQIGNDELFELVSVTPKRILDKGLSSPEDIKEVYELVKFDPELDKAMKSYATQVHEALEEARPTVEDVKAYLARLVNKDIIVDASVDEKDPQMVNVRLKVPVSMIKLSQEALSGSSDRT